ncbi:hypothetical protein EVAR_62918_1 [Eumeta japonica]|uniref:Uncharacterized protein n=1 Tax=Eumeta variegata TaxID=151549 RepID=A0A4C1ZUD1_EUMVA|nr:hypothetical protein EVAR_62918_1 [Eumeta japonica]
MYPQKSEVIHKLRHTYWGREVVNNVEGGMLCIGTARLADRRVRAYSETSRFVDQNCRKNYSRKINYFLSYKINLFSSHHQPFVRLARCDGARQAVARNTRQTMFNVNATLKSGKVAGYEQTSLTLRRLVRRQIDLRPFKDDTHCRRQMGIDVTNEKSHKASSI